MQTGLFGLRLLGPFALSAPDGGRIDISSQKGRALIALLAMAPNGERSRAWLRTMLWETRGEAQAMASLRRELSSLGQLFDAHGAGALLVRGRDSIRLDLDRLTVDALDVAAHFDADHRSARPDFLEGIDLPDGEAFEDWLRACRSRIDDLVATLAAQPAENRATAEAILGEALPPKESLLIERPPPVPVKPSLAVLPFVMDGERDGVIGQAMAEEVSFSLAHYPALFVVAAAAASSLLLTGLSPVDIAHRLGVRYLIDGRVERAGDRLRVAVQLLEGGSASPIWTQRFEGSESGLFELQDDIARAAAAQIWSTIDLSERQRSRSSQLNHADCYALYWHAHARFREWTPEGNREAIRLCARIEAIEPGNVLVSALAGFCNGVACQAGWADDPAASRAAAVRHLQFALATDPNNVEVLGYAAGTMVSIGGDMRVADRLIDRALAILPAYQPTLFWGGWVDISNNRPARARERFELSLRINPASGVRAYAIGGIGITLLLEGAYEDAYAMLSDAVTYGGQYPASLAGFCIAAAMVGDSDSARTALAAIERHTPIENVLSIVRDPTLRQGLDAVIAGLRAA